ncbi:MAG: patatin-like phospholipase family protein [Halieaceae bacterium]
MSIKTGLVLAGGGARAAYQVGVLRAIANILPKEMEQPFPIITGTSAGAINALGLAGRPGAFRNRVRTLAAIWGSLASEDIYRTDALGVARNAMRIGWSLLWSRTERSRALALLDNTPLRGLLNEVVSFDFVDTAIASGELEAIAVTAMNYSNGQSTTFYQGQAHLTPWRRTHRHSQPCQLGIDHLLASSALPTLFPATPLGDDFYGDGALRQTRPLSAAIHLGADRLLIIGVSEQGGAFGGDQESAVAPTIPQVLGQLLNAVFLDSTETDLGSLKRINSLVEPLSARQLADAGLSHLRVIDSLTISPSRSLAALAREYIHELPASTRWFLERTGSIKKSGSGGALSYILFEQGYCQRLMALGYEDAMAKSTEIRAFFGLGDDDTDSYRPSFKSLRRRDQQVSAKFPFTLFKKIGSQRKKR